MLLAAGCQDANQRDAQHALEAHLRAAGAGGYDVDRTHCTRVARMVAQKLETRVFLCTVPIAGRLGCDEFRVTATKGGATFVRTRRDTDCVQPIH